MSHQPDNILTGAQGVALVEVRNTSNSVGHLNQLRIGAGCRQYVRETIKRVNIRNTIAAIDQMEADGVIE